MVDKILADARPEKRLFISLITRDISLIDACLDLTDNSINAALEPRGAKTIAGSAMAIRSMRFQGWR
jgi:hypothetical protein